MLETVKTVLLLLRRALSRRLKGSFLGTMFTSYRPERHYMRGSGPKSRETQSDPATDSKRC